MARHVESVANIAPQDFFVNQGLYTEYSYDFESIQSAENIVYYRGSLDCYCTACKQISIFKSTYRSSPGMLGLSTNQPRNPIVDSMTNTEVSHLKFTCSRDPTHSLFFTMLLDNGQISKIGQSPSYADIHLEDVEQYKKIMDNDTFKEFKKSIGLYTHGVGAGSIVYLRRIIEKFIIEPAHSEAKSKDGWNEKEYTDSKTRERIKILKDYLPKLLVDNTVIYGIVSKGIHELSEEECIQYYPTLKSFIELILTDIKSEKDKEEKKKKLQSDLSSIAGKI